MKAPKPVVATAGRDRSPPLRETALPKKGQCSRILRRGPGQLPAFSYLKTQQFHGSEDSRKMMEEKQLRKIALFLEIISDELYIARGDRDFQKPNAGDPEKWASARKFAIQEIERTRELAMKS